MEDKRLSGYVFSKGLRALKRFSLYFGWPMLAAFSVFLWVEVLLPSQDVSRLFLIGIPWAGLILWLLWHQVKYRGLIDLQFICDEDGMVTQYRNCTQALRWKDGFYLTAITLDFSITKGAQELEFYIVSNQPFSEEGILTGGGLPAIQRLWDQGVLIMPAKEECLTWIQQTFKLESLAQYPRIIYVPSI